MKNLFITTGIALLVLMGSNCIAQISVNIQIGKPIIQERWYTTDHNYYYLPEEGIYYNVNRRVYVFPYEGVWVYSRTLPPSYGNYSYRTSRYVRIREAKPFERDNHFRQKYYSGHRKDGKGHDRGRRGHGQNK